MLAEQSCNTYNLTLCPIYDTLGADSVEFILQQTGMKTCICTPGESVKLMMLLGRAPDLKVIVQIGAIDEKTRSIAEQHVVLSAPFTVGHHDADDRGAHGDRPQAPCHNQASACH